MSVVLFPVQMETSAPALTAGSALTKTVAKSVLEHPFTSVPTTVYVVPVVGETEMEVAVEGVFHEYEIPPLAVKVADAPMQMETSAPALTTGNGFTKTITVSVPLHVSLAVATMYVVVATGLAVGLASVELFNPVEGNHWYVVFIEGAVGFPPIVTLCPMQMVGSVPAFVGTTGFRNMVRVSQLAHPFASVMFTVYCVLTVGDATGLEMLGLLREEAGDQLYVTPLLALSVVLNPGQTHPGCGPAFARGSGLMVTCTTSVFVQAFAPVIVTV